MKKLLASRFAGGMLGSAIAGELPPTFAPWQKIQNCAIATLVQTGKLTASDWFEEIEGEHPSLLEYRQTGRRSEVAATILPAILFFHDLPASLASELTAIASLWLHPEEPLEEILLWGEAIALILQERAKTSQFLLQLARHRPSASNLLNALQEAIDRGFSLHQTRRILSDRHRSPSDIALALYCFSFTPEDPSLCWHRARQLSQHAPLTPRLTGAIAGLYNGSIGCPASWRLSPHSRPSLERSQLLFAAWCGCDAPDRLTRTAIGAAGTLQPRKGFATISQRQSSSPSPSTK
ncbi:MAG: ADP-ribosylglycohydrolase family protein [Spirulina sp.]